MGTKRVIDTIRLKMDDTSTAAAGRMRLAGLKVYINRALVPGSAPSAVAGKFTMLYVPGRGGYFFSTDPVPDRPFVKAGTIDRNRMTFDIDNDSYEAVASAPILTNPDSGELWVYHDPSYKPSGNWTQNLRSGNAVEVRRFGFFRGGFGFAELVAFAIAGLCGAATHGGKPALNPAYPRISSCSTRESDLLRCHSSSRSRTAPYQSAKTIAPLRSRWCSSSIHPYCSRRESRTSNRL